MSNSNHGPFLAPFLKWGDLFVKNRKFFPLFSCLPCSVW